jgi:predicted lipoprotein with Yx(FWY)xxD motif
MMPPEGTDVVMMPAFVQVAESEQFGEILVDGQCRALYAFTQDVEGEPTCIEDCAAAWPPLLVEDESATWFAEELDAELFSTVEHPDGQQGKIGDWPLYYFARDMAAGDLNGHGVGDVWWLVAPDGTLIDGGAGASTASGSSMPADGSMPLDTAVATTTS